jgi:hypothetical protein
MGDRRTIKERDNELDRLFALSSEQFIKARNELVAKLKASGDQKRALQVKALSKPTVAVWAINQLVRLQPEKLAALLQAGDSLRATQARALRSKDSQVELLRTAAQSERQALGELIRGAEEILANAGHPRSASLLGRIESTLHAIATGNGAERELLRAGHLDRELQAVGFPSPAGRVPIAQSSSHAAGQTAPRPAGEELQELRAEVRRAQREEAALSAALSKSERVAHRLRLRAEQAEEAATQVRRESATAQQAVAAAREALADAKRRLERSNAALAAATSKQ